MINYNVFHPETLSSDGMFMGKALKSKKSNQQDSKRTRYLCKGMKAIGSLKHATVCFHIWRRP